MHKMNTQNLALAVMNLPESITQNYPPRPGLPGAPTPSATSIRAWLDGIREALLNAAANTAALGSQIARSGDVECAEELRNEAATLLTLATQIRGLRETTTQEA